MNLYHKYDSKLKIDSVELALALPLLFQLLELPQFQDIIKIKTIGSTYMAASGLNPSRTVKVNTFFRMLLSSNTVFKISL